MNERALIRGISICHPVEVDKDYLLYAVDYAKKNGFDHIQICGPIHDARKGNIDGMTPYRKYSRFDGEKDTDYVARALEAINAGTEAARAAGIKTYMWHHELELPAAFKEVFPETLNGCGDIEVTHPLIRDFLEHKLGDFFHAYPKLDGIVLTLHETKIPLLKLKDQKLDKVQRVKYVTQILYDTCKALGKELIVRPFASIEEDYVMMAKAYGEISPELVVMDKWTQFDWSLTMPHNRFFRKITGNPLMVEADIFGEFFGKGRLPLMLKDHIAQKFQYCEQFRPKGYAARIDRGGKDPFGDVNEVNLRIYQAWLLGEDPEGAIDGFFRERYPRCAGEVRALMEQTEEILKKTIYANGYYFSELSFFPTLNHSKNHFYFEMMRSVCDIASGEWFIPLDWKPVPGEVLLAEKDTAVREAEALLEKLLSLKARMDEEEHRKLWEKFCNLKLVTAAWQRLTGVFFRYARFFETRLEADRAALEADLEALLELDRKGTALLEDRFYCRSRTGEFMHDSSIVQFVQELRESFRIEEAFLRETENDPELIDSILCGSALEGHRLQKEVNFSDTLLQNGTVCRIPGNRRGMEWSSITAHGWFSYELRVKPLTENAVTVRMAGTGGKLDVSVTVGTQSRRVSEELEVSKDYTFLFRETEGKDTVRIRFDKCSAAMPRIFRIAVRSQT